jgi:hypothetical protein
MLWALLFSIVAILPFFFLLFVPSPPDPLAHPQAFALALTNGFTLVTTLFGGTNVGIKASGICLSIFLRMDC